MSGPERINGVGASGRGLRGWGVAALASLAALLASPAVSPANVPFKTITSSGPIEAITIGNDLSCQVKLTQDSVNSFYPPSTSPGDCGVFAKKSGSALRSPDWDSHDRSAADETNAEGVPWTPVSQSAVSGNGTAGSPFTLVTTAQYANAFRVTRTDTYVTGSDNWNIAITATDIDGAADSINLFHAGDCYLAESDIGFGALNTANGSAFCTSTPNNSPPGRVIGFGPSGTATSTGGTVIEGHYLIDVWSRTDGNSLYPNLCFRCTDSVDNGAGVSWARTIPADGSTSVALGGTVKRPSPEVPQQPTSACKGKPATIVGTDGGDQITGTREADVIVGLGGRDVIKGGDRADVICGNGGRDVINGKSGKDLLLGGVGNDRLNGAGKNDRLFGGPGKDRLGGGFGRDRLIGGPGADQLFGGFGKDTLRGGPGKDRQVQ